MTARPILYIIAILSLLFSGQAGANKILWGNSITADSNFQSNGTSNLATGFTFALGTFGAAFTPDSTNVDMWASNWSQLDTAVYNPTFDYFTRETNLTKNDNFNETTYIWIYDTLNTNVNREWLLVTGKPAAPWTVPAFPGNQTNFPTEFYITGENINVVFGRYDPVNFPGVVPPEQGLGTFTGTPATYILQTGSIPEPTTTVLLAVGLLGCFHRRSSFPKWKNKPSGVPPVFGKKLLTCKMIGL